MLSLKLHFAILVVVCSSYLVLANTKYVKILPSDAKAFVIKPQRQRAPISAQFAKKYWISGTFFNKENFQGMKKWLTF
jgi:hypothetical protein